MTELDLRTLVSTLNDHDVRFVTIGGVAVGAHGYIRATEDLDIVPEPVGENIERLSSVLVELDATLPRAGDRSYQPARDEGPLHTGGSLTANTRAGGLDVVQRVSGVPSYWELEQEAVASDLLGAPLQICSLAHLRRMKKHRNTAQDRADLEALG
jgi:hypothetical protein